ncbi:hypothetical protein BJ980_003403 [Nocardioides daedukensis]|uniref:Uncharacterized protein n=1 Tax=Nocardioides daedukensis TaxID=634462 RepID=A0A7Y9UW42_9ACTN|nr:hypothetical protein [Nocardioides daedukensis]
MHLSATCPRCPAPTIPAAGSPSCPTHGEVAPLWRPRVASYDALAEHLAHADGFPTYLPWPMAADWRVTDFGVVRGSNGPRATMSAVAGWTDADGPVELLVVSEEAGTGLGARVARTVHSDPGSTIQADRPAVRIRLDSQQVPLWAIPTDDAHEAMETSVLAGEAHGRWLWLVVRPASAVMVLHKDWLLADVSGIGAPLLELAFGGPAPHW